MNPPCVCGHTADVHCFGMGDCSTCYIAAEHLDDECNSYRPVNETEDAQ